jgi:hypothetical protein
MDVLAGRTFSAPPSVKVSAVESQLPAIEPAGRGGELPLAAGAPFGPERGPLVRGRLVRLGALDHVLLVTLHLLVSDAGSLGVFAHELSVLHAARVRRRRRVSPRGSSRVPQTRFTAVPRS